MKVELRKIEQNPYQVRDVGDDEEIYELAASIKEHGLLQPIKVRPIGNHLELIYGHRRVAAMRLLGWEKCEAIVEGINDDNSLIQSIAENLQRKDLNVIDEGRSYELLVQRGYTTGQIAELVNKPQGRISNRLSILRLPPEVQNLVTTRKGQHETTTESGMLSADSASRIASSILDHGEAIRLAEKAIRENLTSREIRELTSLLKQTPDTQHRALIIERAWNDGAIGSVPAAGELVLQHESNSVSTNDQYHNKSIWNLKRLPIRSFHHFTIGYSSRTVEQFIELLQVAEVDVLADVRYSPVSRFRPEFSKVNLEITVSNIGIEYVHWPDLGIPPEERRTFEKRALFDWYDKNVMVVELLNQRSDLLTSQRVAFMCVELAPESCHRHRISLVLENNGYRLLDL